LGSRSNGRWKQKLPPELKEEMGELKANVKNKVANRPVKVLILTGRRHRRYRRITAKK